MVFHDSALFNDQVTVMRFTGMTQDTLGLLQKMQVICDESLRFWDEWQSGDCEGATNNHKGSVSHSPLPVGEGRGEGDRALDFRELLG